MGEYLVRWDEIRFVLLFSSRSMAECSSESVLSENLERWGITAGSFYFKTF